MNDPDRADKFAFLDLKLIFFYIQLRYCQLIAHILKACSL